MPGNGYCLLDVADEHPIPFIQVRTKQASNWLIFDLQLFGTAEKWTR